jgi:hypothetical protein
MFQFIRDELKVTDKNRQNLFHGNDTQISVNDLWKSWITSEGKIDVRECYIHRSLSKMFRQECGLIF